MTSADFATTVQKALAIWCPGAKLSLQITRIDDKTKPVPTFTTCKANIHSSIYQGKQEVWLHEPQSVTATENVTIFLDKFIPTGRFIQNSAINNIVVCDCKERSAFITDISVPNNFGINRAVPDKVTKSQDLKNALRDEWGL